MRSVASVVALPSARSTTPKSSSPWNFTNGFICIAVTWFLKPGLIRPESFCALSVAAVERVAHRLGGLVHRPGQARAKALGDLPIESDLANVARASLAWRQHGSANLAARDRCHGNHTRR